MSTSLKSQFFAIVAVLLAAAGAFAGEVLPKTLMTTRGRLLVSEDFAKALAPFTGKPVGFASGFSGWKYNGGPGTGKAGRWEIADGTFKGIENPQAHHPATASYGIQFKDTIIQCDVRLNDVPAEGAQESLSPDQGHGHQGLSLPGDHEPGRPYGQAV